MVREMLIKELLCHIKRLQAIFLCQPSTSGNVGLYDLLALRNEVCCPFQAELQTTQLKQITCKMVAQPAVFAKATDTFLLIIAVQPYIDIPQGRHSDLTADATRCVDIQRMLRQMCQNRQRQQTGRHFCDDHLLGLYIVCNLLALF